MLGLWMIIILFVYFGLAPLIAYNVYKNLKYSKLPSKKNYIGFWLRFGAGVADLIILVLISFLVAFFLQLLFYDTNFGPGSEYVLGIIIAWAYVCLLQSSKHQATIGMKFCRFKIVDQNFKKISLGRATLRYFALSLSSVILAAGYFMIGFTKKKQGLHDIFCKTLHINSK
jgi:uncharacterized RDD family membrane protein YckC